MEHINKCPIETALGYIRNKWSIEIIRDLFLGKKKFKDFLDTNPNLSSKVLSERLKELSEKGIIEKKIVSEFPVSIDYVLTERGKCLNKVLYELAAFSCNIAEEHDIGKSCAANTLAFLKKILQINK